MVHDEAGRFLRLLMNSKSETVESLEKHLSEMGLAGSVLEVQADLLILRLDPESGRRLLADAALREAVVRQARESGFSRVALDLAPLDYLV